MAQMKYCLTCRSHHPVGHVCPKREAQRYAPSRERRVRGTAKWKAARTAARRRDGDRCRQCGSTQGLEVHHIVPIAEGGNRFALSNLATLCGSCHHASHRGEGSTRKTTPVHPVLVIRERHGWKADPPDETELLVG
jgi:5-methylcytosine-specific restriction enzyme A